MSSRNITPNPGWKPPTPVDPPMGKAPVPPESEHVVIGQVNARLSDDHPLHSDNNDEDSYFVEMYQFIQDLVAEMSSSAAHERLQNLLAHGRMLIGPSAAKDTYDDIVAKRKASAPVVAKVLALFAFLALFLVFSPSSSQAQSNSVFRPQNNAAASSVGTTSPGATLNPSGNDITVSPGPVWCNGGASVIHNTKFTLTGQQAIPAVTSASGQSQLFFIFYRCASDQVMITIEPPLPPIDVPLSSVLQSNSAGSLSYTITDLRSTSNFPNSADGVIPFGPGDCAWNASGTLGAATGLNLQAIGASFTMVNDISTTNAGASTDNLTCNIHVPQRTTASKGVLLLDCTIYYGVQTTALTSLGAPTLSTITMPAAGAGETPSTVTPVSLGAVTVTPVVGSANLGTTTAGAFFSEKVALNTPVFLNTDLQTIVYNQTFVQGAAAAQIVNTPGGVCHVTQVPL